MELQVDHITGIILPERRAPDGLAMPLEQNAMRFVGALQIP